MMVRHNTPIAQEAPDKTYHGRFLQNIADTRAALIMRIMCDTEMSEAEEARIMINIGRLEHVARCGRYLN